MSEIVLDQQPQQNQTQNQQQPQQHHQKPKQQKNHFKKKPIQITQTALLTILKHFKNS